MQILTSLDLDEVRSLGERGEFFWLDLYRPEGRMLEELGDTLGLHPLAIEDTQEFDQRPKADTYDEDQLLLVYFGACADRSGVPTGIEMHLHIGPRFIVTVQRRPCARFDELVGALKRDTPDDPQEVIYRIIDTLTDSLLDVLERVADRVDRHQAEVFRHPRARDRDRMANLRRSLQSLRRVLVIQRQVFDRVIERLGPLPGLHEHYGTYYRDVGDHLWRAVDEIEAARDSLQGMLETYTNESRSG